MTVESWSQEWLEVYKKPGLTDKSYKNIARHVNSVIIPQIGSLRLVDVTDVHLQKVLNSKAGFSYSEVKHLRDVLKAMFKKAAESTPKLINDNPAKSLEMPTHTKGKRRSITVFERTHFLKAAMEHYAGLMFMTMFYCGVRTGEVVALSWKDIDFDNYKIKVVSAMEGGKDTLKGPKTEAGIREIPIPKEIYYELLKRRGDPFAPVFTQKTTGKRHTQSSRRAAWNSLKNAIDDSMGAAYKRVEAANGKKYKKKVLSVIAPDFVPYCLRHTYCTDLQAKGVPLKTASYLMGHSDISITANIYTHMTDDAMDEAARLVGAPSGVTPKNKKAK